MPSASLRQSRSKKYAPNFESVEMPGNEHLVVCGGIDPPLSGRGSRLELNLHGGLRNVRLQIADISSRLLAQIPDAHIDLLEVASYVYAADSATSRGGLVDAQMGKHWRRKFRFVIPVRQPELWSSELVSSALVETLGFLSDDEYSFEFQDLGDPPAFQSYLEFPDADTAAFSPDEVILFSGGLDSFAGTVEELVASGKKVALVSHRSASKIVGAQKFLVDQLKERFGADHALHVPIWVTLEEGLVKETTHRTRSFLFAALGAVTARVFGKARIRFYENGVVSLNLPPVAQVVGARATRTTHPQVLSGFSRVLSGVFDRSFDVDNPFAWMTKADVIERISANGCGDLIRHTRSCTHVHGMTKLHSHCGQCSQCIDRRFGVLAAGREHEDPAEAYKIDLFTGERPAGPDREMAFAYVRSASDIHGMTDAAFFSRYGEVSRIVDCFSEPADRVAERIFDLYSRHAAAVCRIFDDGIENQKSALREGTLPADCLLTLVCGQREEQSAYPEPQAVVEEGATIGAEIRMAIDEDGRRIVFDRWGEIKGVSAVLLIALAEPFREATRDELMPERYPFTETTTLLEKTNCEFEETLRRRVLRCRNKITKMATGAGDQLPSIDAVIENIPRHGYRLNPDQIRIVAFSELPRER
jgi:hypothetical protein